MANGSTGKPMRVLSAIGPGDVVSAYRDWKGGVRTVSETSITFSSQEFEFFARHQIAFWAVSSHARAEVLQDGENRIENRAKTSRTSAQGWMYHLVQLAYAVSLLRSAKAFRATHAIVDSGTTHWFALWLFRLAGIEVHPNLHNVYWPVGHPPRGAVRRLVLWLDGVVFRSCVRAALGVSPECGRQVAELSRGRSVFFDYRAQFAPADFGVLGRAPIASPGSTVRIMFAGRVEENKGVFDILAMAEQLRTVRPGRFVFDICGSGDAADELARQVASRGLGSAVKLHGKLLRPDLLKVYGASHLVIVPTRSTFCEGLPQVCAEAVLAGRPVLTSRLSNALEALAGAVVEARENDPADYAEKIAALFDDPERCAALVAATPIVGAQFTDRRFGLTAALERCLFGREPAAVMSESR
jgi:glycogen synthase